MSDPFILVENSDFIANCFLVQDIFNILLLHDVRLVQAFDGG
jgi:hypothetical protein